MSLLGGFLLVISPFLPVYTSPPHFVIASARTLWQEGDGTTFAIGGIVLSTLAVRAYGRRPWSYAALWIGSIFTFTAVKLLTAGGPICSRLLVCKKASGASGLYLAGLGSVLVVAGWATARLSVRSQPHAPDTAPVDRPHPPAHDRSADGSGARQRRKLAGSLRRSAWPLLLYLALSFLFFGGRVLGHFGSMIIAHDELDPSAYVWFFGWWPHALLHGLNPFVTKAIFAPDGYNLTWATPVPGPSLIMAPVTLAFGPIVTWNLLGFIAPALSAWTAFLLCRHVTGMVAPSVVGGYIFGFSPYMLLMLTFAPNLYLTALVPVIVLLVLLRTQGSLTDAAFVVKLTLVLTLQFLTGLEILATATVFGAIAFLSAIALFDARRATLLHVLKLLAAAYACAGVLVSPILFYMAFRAHADPIQASSILSVDLVSLFKPDRLLAVSNATGQAFGNPVYLGIPLAILVVLFALNHLGNRAARLALICLLVPAVASLGNRLVVNGRPTEFGLPWIMFARIPGLPRAIPERFGVFMFLAAAVIVTMWLSWRRSGARWAVALVALAFIVPDLGGTAWRHQLTRPAFFASGMYRDYLRRDDRVLLLPVNAGERWQAQAKFGFTLADGAVGALPQSFMRYPAYTMLYDGVLPSGNTEQMRRFLTDKSVSVVVVDKSISGYTNVFNSLDVRRVEAGGVFVYRLRDSKVPSASADRTVRLAAGAPGADAALFGVGLHDTQRSRHRTSR